METLEEHAGAVKALDALSIAEECGSVKAVNVVLLGAASRDLPFDEEAWIKVIEENVYAHQKQKAMVTLPVTAGIMKKDGQKEIIQVQTKWYPKDAGLYHIKVKRVFVSDWFGLLEFPLFRKNAKDVVEVLILPKKQPIVFEFNEESQTESLLQIWANVKKRKEKRNSLSL